MQTRPIARLARILRSTHQKTQSWRMAAEQLRVLCEDGTPNPGLAYDIAINDQMPSPELLARLLHDGAIPRPEPEPLRLDAAMCRAIILALRKRKPLPPPNAQTVREFNKWLECRRSR